MKRPARLRFFLFVALCFAVLSVSAEEKKAPEDLYTIKKGDTLWDISSRFLSNPFLWPKLWQRNPYITNPHWIYPGNTMVISPGEGAAEVPKTAAVEEKPKIMREPEAKKVESNPPSHVPETVMEPRVVEAVPPFYPEARTAGFVSDFHFRGMGVILASKEGKNLMADTDIVYLSFTTAGPVQIGDRYTIFRPSEELRHPRTGKRTLRKYNIMGNVEVIDHFGNFYAAKVIESFDAIEAGDMIQPFRKE